MNYNTVQRYLTEMRSKGLVRKDSVIRVGLGSRVLWEITSKGLRFLRLHS
ncbi:MAG: hypothetical protein ACTSYM_01275 [Candidatus Baldrarchaeia archaeon]